MARRNDRVARGEDDGLFCAGRKCEAAGEIAPEPHSPALVQGDSAGTRRCIRILFMRPCEGRETVWRAKAAKVAKESRDRATELGAVRNNLVVEVTYRPSGHEVVSIAYRVCHVNRRHKYPFAQTLRRHKSEFRPTAAAKLLNTETRLRTAGIRAQRRKLSYVRPSRAPP